MNYLLHTVVEVWDQDLPEQLERDSGHEVFYELLGIDPTSGLF